MVTERLLYKKGGFPLRTDTKERILQISLELFAQNGYLGTSMGDIAARLGITKAALYKHFTGKQEILDSILRRMCEKDAEQAKQYAMPTEVPDASVPTECPPSLAEIRAYTIAQFDYWTKEPFPSDFRKMLTLAQYRDPQMAALYQNYLVSGPAEYMTAIFRDFCDSEASARQMALSFYGPMFFLYSVYDDETRRESALPLLKAHIDRFIERVEADVKNQNDKEKKEISFMKQDVSIRLEEPKDYRTTENLTREAFWNVYCPGCREHYVLHCYRNDPAFVPELDLVMEKDGEMIGQVIYVRSEILCADGRKLPILTFGPISIAPAYKRKGYGKYLLDTSMQKAKDWGAGALAITGNIDFYGKSGFVPAKTKGIRYADDPDADYFLIKELQAGFLDGISGTYHDPAGYFVCEKDPEGFQAFEATFPKKEKLKLPGQLF